MGTENNERSRERINYYYDQLINKLTDNMPYMTDKQLERIESYVKAELWDRFNQPTIEHYSSLIEKL